MAVLQIPVVKSKGVIDVDTERLPEDVYAEAMLQGLKTLVNRGMTKCTERELGSKELVAKEADILAAKNVEKIYAGDIKFSGKATKTKVSGAVRTEALRIAKERVKDAMRAAGYKLSNVKASSVTEAAKALLDASPDIIAEAEAAIAARSTAPLPIDLKSLVHEDPELAAKNAKAAADKKAERQLSATQAGKVKGRKPKAKPTHEAHHSAQ